MTKSTAKASPAAERFALWRETGRLPMAAEPVHDDGRRQFRIRVRRLSGPLWTLCRPHSKPDET
jgi:hypothetical protein